MKVHFIFETHRLKEVHKKQETRKELEITKEQEKYEVKKIIEEKNGKFRIKQKGYNKQN